jgi:hypothetical protein
LDEDQRERERQIDLRVIAIVNRDRQARGLGPLTPEEEQRIATLGKRMDWQHGRSRLPRPREHE